MIVAKFGGSVLNGPEGVVKACDEILRLPRPLLLVVSAFANVTNKLEQLAETATKSSAEAEAQLQELLEYHTSIARTTLGAEAFDVWYQSLPTLATRLKEVVQGLAIVGELSPRTLDLVVHFGERFSSSIVSAALRDRLSDSEEHVTCISARDLIITDAHHRYARPDRELTKEMVGQNLIPLFKHHKIVVTEGYIARSVDGEVTTMGRESSDYSATLLGELLEADTVKLYTGVPGILTADPVIHEGAETLSRMSYTMAHSLAELGAKVLHPRTVRPVWRSTIPLVITRIDGSSTTIDSEGDRNNFSIVTLPEAGLLTLETSTTNVRIEPFLEKIASSVPVLWYHRFRRTLKIITALPYSKSMPVHLIPEDVQVSGYEEVSLISLVREERLAERDLSTFFSVVEAHNPRAVQGGIQPWSITAAMDREVLVDVTRELHDCFRESLL